MRVLSPQILITAALVIYGIAAVFYTLHQWRCPRCRRYGLRRVGGYIWSSRNRQGIRSHDEIAFFYCRRCSARLRCERNEWADVGEEEWKKHAGKAP